MKTPRHSSLFGVLAAVVALGGGLVFGGAWIFSRYLTRQMGARVEELRASAARRRPAEANEAHLGLPVYPGATRRTPPTASLTLPAPPSGFAEIAVAEFETTDALEKVAAFYRAEIGPGLQERRAKETLDLSYESPEGTRRIIVLSSAARRTVIVLAQLTPLEAP